MPSPLIQRLYQDSAYRNLPPESQLIVMRKLVEPELRADPNFAALPPDAQEKVIQTKMIEGIPLVDYGRWDDIAKEAIVKQILNQGGSGTQSWTEFAMSTVMNSGLATGLLRIFEGQNADANAESRRRLMGFFDATDKLLGKPSSSGEKIGAVIGTLGDIFAVNKVMGPLTKGAASLVGVAARGGAKAAATAASIGLKTAPIMRPMLATLGPIATESAIEAVPYFLLEEQKRWARGEEPLISSGLAEVAKSVGINAAADFLVGTVMQSVLLKGAKILFGPSDLYQAAYRNAAEEASFRSKVRTGRLDPAFYARTDPIKLDAFRQKQAISDLLSGGDILEGSAHPWPRTQYLAHDLGLIVGKADNGEYRLWKYGDDGRPAARNFSNLTDLENTLSYEAFSEYAKLGAEAQQKFLSAHANWALPRGATLHAQRGVFGGQDLMEADPALAALLKKNPKAVKPASLRPVVSMDEANKLASLGDAPGNTVVRAKIPLKGSVVDAVNGADMNLLRSSPSVRVSNSLEPNALFVGVRMAAEADYASATKAAEKAIGLDPALSLDAARASELLNRGFDHFRHADGTVEFFGVRNMRLIGTVDDVLYKPKVATVTGPGSAKTIVTESTRFKAGAETLGKHEDVAMSAAVKALRSDNTEDMRNFAKLYASGRGSNVEVNVRRVAGNIDPKVTRSGDTINILYGKSSNYKAERRTFEGIMRGLDEATLAGPGAKSADYWASKFTAKVEAFKPPEGLDEIPWIRYVVKKLGGELNFIDGIPLAEFPDGSGIGDFGGDMVTRLSRRVADETIVRQDLLSQGITVRTTKNGFEASLSGKNRVLAQGKTFPELLDDLNYTPSTVSTAFGPNVVEITEEGIAFELAGTKTFRSYASAAKFLSKFKDGTTALSAKPLVTTLQGAIREVPDGTYLVHVADFDADRVFTSLGEARDFLRRSGDLEIHELRELAQSKNADVYIRNGTYRVVYGDSIHTANNMDELKTVLKDIPDIQDSVPNLVDMDPALEASVHDLVAQYAGMRRKYRGVKNPYNLPPEFDVDPTTIKSSGWWDESRKMFSNFTGWIEDVSRRTNNPGLAKAVARFRDAHRQAISETSWLNRELDTIFRKNNGRYLSADSRRRIFYSLGANSDEQAEVFAAQYQTRYRKALTPLNAEEKAAAEKLSKLYDDLAVRFGIRYKDLVTKYMPRLRDLVGDPNAPVLANITTAKELLDRYWKGEVPKELKFWAEHSRVEDVTRMFLKDDAYEVAAIYISQGNKKLFLNDRWTELRRFIDASGISKDEGLIGRLDLYRENIMSSYHSAGEKNIENFGRKFFKHLAESPIGRAVKADPELWENAGSKLFPSVMSLTYMSTMGWKPFLAIRNALQPLTQTAPRVGLYWVLRSYKEVMDNPKAFIEKYRSLGVISERPPLVGQLFGHETRTGRIVESAMSYFKNSDDFTRAVAYHAGELRFDNALFKYRTGQITNLDAFVVESGLSRMDEETIAKTLDLLNKSEDLKLEMPVASARDYYAHKLQQDTMFDYSGADTPAAHQTGLMGRLFGQFGTYSAGYRANMARIMKYGTFKDRATGIATYLAVSAALYAGFEAMRIKTSDFTPFAGALFSGGPGFDIAVNAIKSLDGGYEGERARAELLQGVKSIAPGSAQIRALTNFQKYSAEGDDYGAFLSLLMTPVHPVK